jgi:hypothetical protein
MAFAGPSKTCPRCNSVVPASATFCGTCGLQFPASPAPEAPPPGSFAPTQVGAPPAPAGWPQSQPGYPPPGSQPGYPGQPGSYPPPAQPGFGAYGAPGQPAYPGVFPPPVATPPKRGRAGLVIVLVVVLVVLVGGGAAAFVLLHGASNTNNPLFDRHGLQSNVPLPNNTTYVLKKSYNTTDTQTNATITADAWGWTVGGTNPTAIEQFYTLNLPKNGWKQLQLIPSGNPTEHDLSACQGGQVLIIGASSTKFELTDSNGKVTDTVTAPSGGSALITELSSSPTIVALLCSGTPLFPTP